MNFTYSACDERGSRSRGATEASDMLEAIDVLRKKGLFVTGINPDASGSARGAPRGRLSRSRILRNLAMFTRQLHVLTSSGTALVDALASLERQGRDARWRDIVADVRRKVEEGLPLSEAMAAHPNCFDAVCVGLTSAGETGGSMEKMFDRLATLSRKQLQLRSALTSAMIYPCLLLCIAFSVLALMLFFVLPRFAGLFGTLNVALPPTTRFLMDLSSFLKCWWWLLLVTVVGGAIGFRTWSTAPGGRAITHRAVLHLPIAGPIIRSLQVARIVRVLGVLLAGKVPLLQALGLAKHTATNLQFVHLVSHAERAVTQGFTISSVLGDSPLIEPSLCEAIRSGERSGELGALLLNMADFLDEENEVVVRSLTSVLEPLILIVLGIIVGFVALSMFLPMFDLTAMH